MRRQSPHRAATPAEKSGQTAAAAAAAPTILALFHKTQQRKVTPRAILLIMVTLILVAMSLYSTPKLLLPSHITNTLCPPEVLLSSPPQLELLQPSKCNVGEGSTNFERVYNNGEWGNKFNSSMHQFYNDAHWPPKEIMSSSGGGSNRGDRTVQSMAILKHLIHTHNITTMLDVPCGDVNWIFDSYETDFLPLYVGLDIVGPVIALNQERFKYHTNKHFAWWDGIHCAFPKHNHHHETLQPFDVIHSRDVIQHLPLQQGLLFVCNVMLSGAKWFVTTTYPHTQNTNIQHGQFYLNNLHEEPFSLPNVGVCEATHPQLETDLTCVYDLSADWVAQYRIERCGNTTF